jgi:hypothetical protein
MPVIQKAPSIAAGATNDNLYSGSAYEFARQPTLLSMGVTESATGMFFTFQSGSDVVVEESEPVIATRFPIIPDEMYYNDVAAPGDRIVLRVRNPTAGALTARTILQLSPMG